MNRLLETGQPAYGGTAIAGFAVGVLVLDTRYPLLPGNAQHAASFNAPVLYEKITLDDPHALMRGDPSLTARIVEGAQRLQAEGVRVVAGACGSFAYYQRAAAQALSIPVFMSVMLQAPLLQAALGPSRKLLVLCARASALTPRLFQECGISNLDTLVIRELWGHREFELMLAGDSALDIGALRKEVLGVVARAQAEHPEVAAVLLQCSDLPPFASDIQEKTGLPVFDVVLMIRWLTMAGDYTSYSGSVRTRRLAV